MTDKNLISMLRLVLMDARQNASELGYNDDVEKVDHVTAILDEMTKE